MTLASIFFIVLVLALFLWVITIIPIAQPYKQILYVVLVVLMVFWLLSQLGMAPFRLGGK
jgi:hypothetical protein